MSHQFAHPSGAIPALRSRRGASALEFAIIAPVIITALVGVADLGIAFYQTQRLEEAARSAAAIVPISPEDRTRIETIVAQNLPGISHTVSITDTGSDACANPGHAGATREVTVSVGRTYTGFVFVRGQSLVGNAVVRLP